jgi:predicted dehydrogenase
MGESNLGEVESENIVALCDVDYDYAADVFLKYPRAARYRDYRRMFEEQDDIDAVIIATPDHTHAPIALDAMDLGLHVYVQKPLTWSVAEARALKEKAQNTDVVTQMGNQGHSSDDARRLNELVWNDAIGEVREVHVWTNRPLWPQGIDRPVETPPIPDTLSWDLFLGPAPYQPYHSAYHPWDWRGWVDYGTGSLGDMGAHLIDHPYWALHLDRPVSVETRSTPYNGASFPLGTITYYDFAAREEHDMPPVRLTWYDGGLTPPRPDVLPDDEEMNVGGGGMLVGEKGVLLHDTYGSNPRIRPLEVEQEAGDPPQEIPRVDVTHEMNWVQACKGEGEATCPFEYASDLTETMLLGVVALKAGQKIEYDSENMRVTNVEEANRFLDRRPRDGWHRMSG